MITLTTKENTLHYCITQCNTDSIYVLDVTFFLYHTLYTVVTLFKTMANIFININKLPYEKKYLQLDLIFDFNL